MEWITSFGLLIMVNNYMKEQSGYAMLFGIIFIVIITVALIIGVSTVQNAQLFMPNAKGSPRPLVTPFTSYKQMPNNVVPTLSN